MQFIKMPFFIFQILRAVVWLMVSPVATTPVELWGSSIIDKEMLFHADPLNNKTFVPISQTMWIWQSWNYKTWNH